MMNALEQRFMERVPSLLNDIAKATEAIAKAMTDLAKGQSPDMGEQKPAWKFDELAFIEEYCPMQGGNNYLGWIDDIYKLLNGEAEPGDAASTGEYANCSEEELRKELKRLTAIVLHQAVDEYVEQNY